MQPQINITTDWDETPGWMPMGVGLPDNFLEGEPATVLSTIAMLCMQPRPKQVEPHPQALATLALYASGCTVTLSTQQFRKLERTVLQYMDVVGGEDVIHTGVGNGGQAFALGVRRQSPQIPGRADPDTQGGAVGAHNIAVLVSSPSRIRPIVSNIRGATIACCVATLTSRKQR